MTVPFDDDELWYCGNAPDIDNEKLTFLKARLNDEYSKPDNQLNDDKYGIQVVDNRPDVDDLYVYPMPSEMMIQMCGCQVQLFDQEINQNCGNQPSIIRIFREINRFVKIFNYFFDSLI